MSAETTGIDPYETVLADLRAKQAQIEQAIAAIESLRGSAGVSAPVAPAGTASNTPSEGSGAFLGMSIVDATKKLLAGRRQTLKTPEILAALRTGGLVLTSKEPINVIGSVLTRHFNDVGDIVRVERGTWGLKEWYPGRSFNKKEVKPDNGGAEKPASQETKTAV